MIIIGGLLSSHLRGAGSVFEDQITRRDFGIICGIELGAGGLGALLLTPDHAERDHRPERGRIAADLRRTDGDAVI